MRRAFVLCLFAVAALLSPAGAAAALSLSVTTPLSAFTVTPGTTATASAVYAVTPDVLNPNWSLSIADTTGNAGHLARGTTGCSGVEAQTANALRARASGLLPATTSAGTKTVSAIDQPLASGVGADAVTVNFSLVVLANEVLSTACQMKTTVTYTLQ